MTMESATDPYELKLFQMFQSCETDQYGLLNEEALRRLCVLLELRDKGAALITSLAVNGGLKLGVSFEQFKEALLNFLGTEYDGNKSTTQTTTAATTLSNTRFYNYGSVSDNEITNDLNERSLVISDDVEKYIESPPEESSDREVSPKLVVGVKKYGRRSRPQLQALDEFSVTDSDNTDEDQQKQLQQRSINGSADEHNASMHVQRSASQTDLPGCRRLRTANLNGNKLKRCSSLPARKNLQQTNKITTLSKSKNATPTTTTTNTNAQNLKQQNSSMESLDAAAISPTQLETLSAHSIIDIWERANIANARGMLVALGFDEDEVNLLQLNKVLEDELRNLDDEPHANMMRAFVALQTAELNTLRLTFRQVHDENIKLRADNKESNRRVTLLAVEIDERHALLEETSKKQIQALEQRHATVVRELTTRMANDRDNWTQLTARLEAQIRSLEQDEVKLKTELDLIRKENVLLETDQLKTQKQISELLEQNEQLNHELSNIDLDANAERSECADGVLNRSVDDAAVMLIEKISTLQMENSNLRDKNDELIVEVENLNLELTRAKSKVKKSNVLCSSPANETFDESTDDIELGSNGVTATKRRGDSPSKTRITEESPRLGKLRKCANDTSGISDQSDTSGEWLALNSELQRSTVSQEAAEEIAALKAKVVDLEIELKVAKAAIPVTSDSNVSAEERCKELESSLEQMQRAYEDCEDYWQSKLSEERQLFEKERQIYEDEQHESDKKFTELMEKVREYEEQYSKDGRLSPIEERDMLEQQYADLEAEASDIRENARQIFEEKSKEIESLQSEIEDLRMRLGESVEILTGACELNNEAVRNEANGCSPASSPISYLWHQSTIQEPAKNCATLNENVTLSSIVVALNSPNKKTANRNNLSTSETTIFSTTPVDSSPSLQSPVALATTVTPIQKPQTAKKQTQKQHQQPQQQQQQQQQQQNQSEGEIADCETSSTTSGKSFDTHTSAVSTQSATRLTKTSYLSNEQQRSSPSSMKEELKRLKFFEISLREQIKDLSLQRDGLVMELQQLQEAKPVLEKAYARTAHPTLIQRVNQLELKNRHLQNVIKQQQQYTESLMQQSWRQHQVELNDLHGRIETQGVMLAEQSQRLQNADILVKDLYVENAHLTATVQRLEQQRARINLLHQQQQLQHQQQQLQQQRVVVGAGLGGLPGMP